MGNFSLWSAVIGLFVGAICGVMLMAMMNIGRSSDDELHENLETARLDFLGNGEFSLTCIGSAWAVVEKNPTPRVIGTPGADVRDVIDRARAAKQAEAAAELKADIEQLEQKVA
jgi:hypothetical protein